MTNGAWSMTVEPRPIRLTLEGGEHFGHCSLLLRCGAEWIRVNCAAETAGRDLLEWLSSRLRWGAETDG